MPNILGTIECKNQSRRLVRSRSEEQTPLPISLSCAPLKKEKRIFHKKGYIQDSAANKLTSRMLQHAVGVCDNGQKAGGADDGAAGAAGGGDIRGVQLSRKP
jgi:hypothetical protein